MKAAEDPALVSLPPVTLPDLEFRTISTATRAQANIAAERVIGRREAYMSSVA